MNGWKWGLLAYLVFSVLSVVGSVGKPRRPVTPGLAVGVIVINALVSLAVVFA